MQRTVHGTRFTYAATALDENGNIVVDLREVTIPEKDPQKALKKARKNGQHFEPLKVESVDELWVLDDEIFFKYANKVDPKSVEAETEEE